MSTGIYSGVNFSDIHGEDTGGKWKYKPGPVQGLYLGWSFSKSLGIQTGINFSSVYYEHKTTYSHIIYFNPSYSIIDPGYYPLVDKMDFSFLRFPLLLTVSIPSALQFTMKAGVVFSFLQDHSLGSNYYYYPEPDNIKKKDFGYMFSSGISYPITDRFKAAFNVNYLTGRKQFLENYKYRHGSSEFTLGIDYSFLKKSKSKIGTESVNDSTSENVTVTYWGGTNISWNPHSVGGKKYSAAFGPSLGLSINIPLNFGYYFISGISFERIGYSMKDSSSLFYRYIKDDKPGYYVDTKVQIDYAVIPLLISIPVGKAQKLFFNTGPWLGLKLNARNTGSALNENRSQSSYTVQKTVIYDDIEKLIKGYNIGWLFGCGLSLPLVNNYSIDIGLQYSAGLKDVFSSSLEGIPQNTNNPDPIIRMGTLSLHLGIRIP
jgi:opacity protein-like surface antigen